jgi:hypothetical protein
MTKAVSHEIVYGVGIMYDVTGGLVVGYPVAVCVTVDRNPFHRIFTVPAVPPGPDYNARAMAALRQLAETRARENLQRARLFAGNEQPFTLKMSWGPEPGP